MAGDIDLTPGKFTVRQCAVEPLFCPSGEVATQLLIAKNNGPPIFNLVVECAFFRGSDFLETERNFTLNVDTEQTAYIEVTSGKAAGACGADGVASAWAKSRMTHYGPRRSDFAVTHKTAAH
jgi:hypothetical protein